MRFAVLRTTIALFLPAAAGCGYDYVAPSSPLPSGLWSASGSPSEILRLDPSQLTGIGNRTPAISITTPSARLETLVGIAFAASGDMWIANQEDSLLLLFAPDALTRSGSRAATAVIAPNGGSLSGPTGLAFDSQHRLWVANSGNGTLVRFGAAQLASTGAPAPEVVLSGLVRPTSLAFDAAGSLWVSDIRAHTVAKYLPAQLAVSGSPAPAVVLHANASSLVNPSVAFDASGTLWVANAGNQTLAAFTPAQLSAGGSPVPHVVLSSTGDSLSIPVGLAFDGEKSLWVMSGDGILEKFASSSLGSTGAPAPSVQLRLTGHLLFWSVAFWPRPAGLPLT